MSILLEDKDFYDNSNGGVTLSGGECLLYADFCENLLKKLKENKINTAVDTCGFVPKSTLDKVIPYTDVFLYDIKAFDSNVHKKYTGQSNEIILENLRYLDAKGCKIEIRIPFIPGINDGEIDKIGEFLKTLNNIIKVKVLPYHNYAGSKYQSLSMVNTLPLRVPTETEIKNASKKEEENTSKIIKAINENTNNVIEMIEANKKGQQ
jgi:pyruvate formate lyase activating enzyme